MQGRRRQQRIARRRGKVGSERHKRTHLGLGDFLLHLLVALSLEENSVVQLLLNLALGPFLLLAPAAGLCIQSQSDRAK